MVRYQQPSAAAVVEVLCGLLRSRFRRLLEASMRNKHTEQASRCYEYCRLTI
jgi:hypothetical protein